MRLATVFSGIGSIEHALERMNIKHEIVFASDNGGINIFEKKINKSNYDIDSELEYLENHFESIAHQSSEYFSNLVKNKLKSIKDIYNNINLKIEKYNQSLLVNNYIKDSYEKYDNIEIFINLKSLMGDKFVKSTEYTKLTKEVNSLIKELNQLHQVIGITEVKNKLEKMNTYEEKKVYVDSLYDKGKKTNYVKQSYINNYNIDEKNFHWDINFIDGKQYENQVDLFVGGSPCQSFSLVGKRKGLDDTRGTLFYDYARLIKEINPKVFIFENVKGLLSHDGGQTWDLMTKVFNELPYTWDKATLNSKDFGIPQNRERLFVVGIRNDLVLEKPFQFPSPRQLELKMKDFLLDNVSGKYYLQEKGVKFVTDEKNLNKKYTQIDGDIQLCQKANQQFNWHGDFVFVEENKDKEKLMEDLEKYFLSEKVKKYVLSSGTKNFYSKPQINLDIARPLLQTMHKMHRSGVDNYVETEGRLRKLTPRECLRLMGYCDSFKIVVSDTQMYRQAGNSIVVDVMIAIVDKIIESYPKLISNE